jgi:hypothetical protein
MATASCNPSKRTVSYNEVVSPPPIQETVKDTPVADVQPAVTVPDTFELLILMPFELKENFTFDTTDIFYNIRPNSIPAVHFYEGAVLAADELSKSGITVNLTALESPADSSQVDRITRSSMWREADYIIGKVVPQLTAQLVRRASADNKQLILTHAVDPTVLNGNANVMLLHASTMSQCRSMAQYIAAAFSDSQISVVTRTVNREDYLGKYFMDVIRESNPYQRIIEFDATTKTVEDLVPELSIIKHNLVLITSSDEAFVSPYISGLNGIEDIEYVTIAGLPTWQDFESINFMQYDSLELYLFENNFVDRDISYIKDIRSRFVKDYFSDPSPSGYSGYLVVKELCEASSERGEVSVSVLTDSSFSELPGYYRFERPDSTGGFENNAVSILKLEEYKFRVQDRP